MAVTSPPFGLSVAPMKYDASLARNAAVAATSSGRPSRPSGVTRRAPVEPSGWLSATAPPLTFTLSTSGSSSRSQAAITDANASSTLLHERERGGGELGLVSMCCGGGLGTATMIERL